MMAVQVSIHEFNIHKKMVSDGQHGLQCLPGCQQTGLNGGIRAGILAQLKDFRSKLPLHQHFTAGQGNAAVFSEKDLIPQKGIRGFPGGGSFAVNRHSCRGTGIHTNSALVAGTVSHMDSVSLCQCSVRAGGNTAAAMQTNLRVVPQKRIWGDAFRVLAPGATQGATLKKQGASEAFAVMDGEALYIKNDTCHTLS